MATERYIHALNDVGQREVQGIKKTMRTFTLGYKGKKVLVADRFIEEVYNKEVFRSEFIVPGYVIGELKKRVDGENVPVTDVEPITDPREIQELTDLLRGRFPAKPGSRIKPIDFWP